MTTHITHAQIESDLVPLLLACDRTLEDLINETGWTENQVKNAWYRYVWRDYAPANGLFAGVLRDGWTWLYCLTSDPALIARLTPGYSGTMVTRLEGFNLAQVEAAYQAGLITARQYRAFVMIYDEFEDAKGKADKNIAKKVSPTKATTP